MLKGEQYVEWNSATQKLEIPAPPPARLRVRSPKIQAKARVRMAKFTKNRPRPVIVPATNEYKDYMDAKLTQKALDYQYRRTGFEKKFRDALGIMSTHGHSYIWFYWDESIKGRVKIKDPTTGKQTYTTAELGDLKLEVGSPHEVLVADSSIQNIGDQPEIMRVKYRDLSDMQRRYPDKAKDLKPSEKDFELFRYERQIASLSPQGVTSPWSKLHEKDKDKILVKEHFVAPCGKYPNGRA